MWRTSAPAAIAGLSGVLIDSPPSTYASPSTIVGGKTPGIDAEACRDCAVTVRELLSNRRGAPVLHAVARMLSAIGERLTASKSIVSRMSSWKGCVSMAALRSTSSTARYRNGPLERSAETVRAMS